MRTADNDDNELHVGYTADENSERTEIGELKVVGCDVCVCVCVCQVMCHLIRLLRLQRGVT